MGLIWRSDAAAANAAAADAWRRQQRMCEEEQGIQRMRARGAAEPVILGEEVTP